ncbi:FAD-dependent oxidoreductase [Melittangium boletus]|uniref:FAD dependent oxidoreductase domain-containing protein n=1 Tax=Melittangium boletus DSM 14713 TaxID=1294270 RepID=A0A250IBJ8_9BACT|nr:FAD-dependent oxidoreductase [Melittangium boletus]ATB28598.1 hypothetical protein MEBOL_002047 [Melittangium boletus DSM 14713]
MTLHIRPEDVLAHMQVRDEKGVFVVGCFEKRVTLLSQQVRSLNLVYALHKCERLWPGSKVAVIGGGVAGMTAAAAAARIGCEVTLLEKQAALLNVLRGNTTRYVHPHVYDWPLPGSERTNADLPLLSWEAASAKNVVLQLEKAWNDLPERSRIKVFFNVKSIDILDAHEGRRHLTWTTPSQEDESFDAILLTVGFGLEKEIKGVHWLSYWDNDRLNQTVRGDGVESYLVSGCGDGGLVDLLRLRLHDFSQEHVLEEFLNVPSQQELKARLLEIEDRARLKSDPNEASLCVLQGYKELPGTAEIDDRIRARLRDDTKVTLNGIGERALGLQSSILNRLLVSRLLFKFGTQYRRGEIGVPQKQGDLYQVRFVTGKPELFNHVICRHGPQQPSALDDAFPDIGKKCDSLRARNELDQTRWPLWPHGFFGSNESYRDILILPGLGGANPSGKDTASRRETPGALEVDAPVPPRNREDVSARTGPARPRSENLDVTSQNGPAEKLVVQLNVVQQVNVPVQQQLNVLSSAPQSAISAAVEKKPNKLSNLGQSGAAGILVLGLAGAWLLFGGNQQRKSSATQELPRRDVSKTPNVSKSAPVRPSDPVQTPVVSKPAPVRPSEPDRGETVLAGGTVADIQQLRDVHRVRVMGEGAAPSLLGGMQPGTFGFAEPSVPSFSAQTRVTNSQASNWVEVHRLVNGRLYLVGYVWDVESRAVGTGRPTNVVLFSKPYGRSQELVSIPLDRVRSVALKNEQGQLAVGLDLNASRGI